MQAAQAIVTRAVPRVAHQPREQIIWGHDFHAVQGDGNGQRLSFYQDAIVSAPLKTDIAGPYVLKLELVVDGGFDFDPGRCTLTLSVGDYQVWQQNFDWEDGKKATFDVPFDLPVGEQKVFFQIHPLTPREKKKHAVDMHIINVRVAGPMDEKQYVAPENYHRFFAKDEAPADGGQRREYARQTIAAFTFKALRRPADDRVVDRLAALAESVYSQPGKSFEDGVAQAMVAVLASPRFLFRIEQPDAAHAQEAHGPIDEFALASRLSYFLWSTMPDDQLFDLASHGELRKNLPAQVKRMLEDPRSEALVKNFTGQWLELRDVDSVPINSRFILRQDSIPPKTSPSTSPAPAGATQPPAAEKPKRRTDFSLDPDMRRAIREEPERLFARVMHENRSVVDLLDANYSFLNERLAKLYGIPGVSGEKMQLTPLPPDSPRGGLMTMSAFLMVTSNPTRTSPVKRGQFILDNILGMPAPPPPPDIPPLEAAQSSFRDHAPTFREVLELHRSKPLCASCHSRMDPLGLALENFNALGIWRDTDKGQPIDAAGKLLTGESFQDITHLKKIVANQHRSDFYRCLSEKMLTYALGRGLEYYDVEAIDRIVARLELEDGAFSALLNGVIESVAFQQRRNSNSEGVATALMSNPDRQHQEHR